jgi:hypothetical protein
MEKRGTGSLALKKQVLNEIKRYMEEIPVWQLDGSHGFNDSARKDCDSELGKNFL